ncbi:unnamed protein product [Kuraishia capsulata CBS 1993]|uniref:Nudix hydrolase domain-containing protein n=1 Tax=Kuraishia capsulata CBS 1993 TaxID=1382522 RepID=W6MT81_9ASCO|nr:uncharacterized protein KUCA_T00005943001 [Kuraishia capsulata CBS 1993]CDK29949.1 unnamed protein product [Kuraishia capsulata CBS 1993]
MSGSFLKWITCVDVAPYPHEGDEYLVQSRSTYVLKSHDGGMSLGLLLPIVVDKLRQFDEFLVDDRQRVLKLSSELNTLDKRNQAIARVAGTLRQQDAFDTLRGWRDELYVVYDDRKAPYFMAERAFCPLLGVVMYGVHIIGYVPPNVSSNGVLKIWVPRRSATKQTYPGMLDNTVAGGLGYPYGLQETCLKECYEEAGLDPEFVKQNCKSAGVLSYMYQHAREYETEAGLIQPEVEYVYDLTMDEENNIPHPVDNEAEDFKLMPVDEVLKRLEAGEFKPNCGAVIIDFLIRKGFITPEQEPNYHEIVARLHRLLPFPTM